MRLIGVRHRVKKTAKGEARPTMVAIKDGDRTVVHELADDQAELDFLLHLFPIAWRPAVEGDNPSLYRSRHCKWKKDKESGAEVLAQVPVEFEGLISDDTVLMSLGGSGDRFAAALSRRGEEVEAKVCRLPPFSLKELRGEVGKDDDHLNLIRIFETQPDVFREMTPRDRALIRVREAYFARQEVQRARIGCEQRLRQQFIGTIFLSEEGRYPEGEVEALFDAAKANDKVFQGLLAEEKQRDRDLKVVVHALSVWKIFEGVEGAGVAIAAGIISAVGDIRLFANEKKLKAFCGVHVLSDGRIPRRRSGQVANWSPRAKQALYLLADQFNRRPDSDWGKKLREYKVKLRAKHPEPILVSSDPSDPNSKKVKRYTDGHIHKMALWRTVTKFVEWLYREWSKLERETSTPALIPS